LGHVERVENKSFQATATLSDLVSSTVRCVAWQLVAGKHTNPIFKGQAVQERSLEH